MTLSTEKQEGLIKLAMQLAEETAEADNLPFAALLVDKSGEVVITGKNTVNTSNNAAAHAEINVLFKASTVIGSSDLSDYSLVSNAASCPMCTAALIKAKITEFYYGAANEGTMVPNITMDEVVKATPFSVEVHSGILEKEASAQIHRLAKR